VNDDNKSENITKINKSELHIHRPSGMRRHLERLGSGFGLEKANKDLLRSKNDESRIRVLDFLFWCMQPRMYMAGETKQGHHVEAYFARKTGQSAYTAQHLRMLAQFVFR
jgi:hypothetical protein